MFVNYARFLGLANGLKKESGVDPEMHCILGFHEYMESVCFRKYTKENHRAFSPLGNAFS